MNLTFRKLILFSTLTIILGVGLVYGMSVQFRTGNQTQKTPTSHNPQPLGEIPVSEAHILVFAYVWNDGGFVQSSVTAFGQLSPPVAVVNVETKELESITNETDNGTTTTDVQNPLIFTVSPGVYSILATYADAPPQNITINATDSSYNDAIFNFGSSPPPPLGHIIVIAEQSDPSVIAFDYLQASVSITGPETLNGTTSGNEWNPTVFTVAPGTYSVFATYGSAAKNATAIVTAGNFTALLFDFTS